jgi:glutaredoxin
VVVYGGSWCIDCHVVTRYLDREKVPYRWVDLARDHEAQERLTAQGYRAIPVVVLPDGRTLVEPSTRELARALAMDGGAG